MFGRNYTSDTSIHTILSCVYGLLLAPEPDDPLDSSMAEAFFADRTVYDANARAVTLKHAMVSLRDWKVKLLGTEEADALEASQLARAAAAPPTVVSASAASASASTSATAAATSMPE